ncbi:MAG: glycoside hydrolase family 88 protein [Bryobacterales bacterium]|nr:glycoside hydrolase family 88 protein [Bryobacterales bacterium]MBV9399575.1 glycoside hydrolase family 88 protein [Bryobacterales bacterium]
MIHLLSDNGASGHADLFAQAFQFAQKQVRKLIDKHPGLYPLYTQNGVWDHAGPAWTHWCDGFLPGLMWIFHKHADKESAEGRFWLDNAVKYTKPLEARKSDPELHDLGFLFFSTYYRWYRITHDAALREVLIEAGRTLSHRFQEQGQYLRSFVGENSLFIDIMMNVGIIFYAARETGDRRLRDVAMRHSLTTRRVLVRGDGSTAHEGIFDTETGEFLRQATYQGYRGDSCWSRGLAWALYGFTSAYEYSHDSRFLETAQACADFYISHSPADGIPPWDFNAPPENRTLCDSSAAAICAAGLLRLRHLTPDSMRGHLYWSAAVKILRSLCEKQLAAADPKWEGILKGGVYHVHKGLGVDESVMWGEYFFCEALERVLW